MSSTNTSIPENGLTITSEIPDVEEGYYDLLFKELDMLNNKNVLRNTEHDKGRYVIANYIYLTYEHLQLNTVREIDYDQVRDWGHKNRILAELLLCKEYLFKKKKFPLEAFLHWIYRFGNPADVGMIRYSMYQ